MSLITVFAVAEYFLKLIIVILVIIIYVLFLDFFPGQVIERLSIAADKTVSILIIVSIALVMDIPRREIQSHIDIILCTCRGNFFQYVFSASLTVPRIIRCSHIVFCILTVPDTEAVVMLRRHDKLVKPCVLYGLDQGFCIKILAEGEDFAWRSVAVIFSPLDLVKRIRAEVAERRKLFFLVIVLVFTRQYLIRLRLVSILFLQVSVADPLIRCLCRNSGSDPRHCGCRHGSCHQES